MATSLHIKVPNVGLSFFLDVADYDDLNQGLRLLDSKIAGSNLLSINDMEQTTSLDDLILAAPYDQDELDITQLSDLVKNSDRQPLPSPLFVFIDPATGHLTTENHHPLLPTVDDALITTFCTPDDGDLYKPTLITAAYGAIYGAYYQALSPHALMKSVEFLNPAHTKKGLQLHLRPFTSMQQALAANGIR